MGRRCARGRKIARTGVLSPELSLLHWALDRLHRGILYEELGIEHIGYSEELFRESLAEPANRTLADRLVWILERGGTLRAVQVRDGQFTGPTLTLETLRASWQGLDQGDLAAVPESERAVETLRALFRLEN